MIHEATEKSGSQIDCFLHKALLFFPELLMYTFKFGCLKFREEMRLHLYMGNYRSIYSDIFLFLIFHLSCSGLNSQLKEYQVTNI